MGEWRTDRHGRWVYDASAPDPDPTNTRYGGFPMPRDDDSFRRDVYDPDLGSDGGGRSGSGSELPAIDPDQPVNDVGELRADDGPEHWVGSDPAITALSGALSNELTVCPACGTGVSPERLRS